MNIAALKLYYSELADDQLEALVAEGLTDLVPEALPVLSAELTGRGLLSLAQAVQLQNRGPEPGEIDAIVAWLRASACPICGHRGALLNGSLVHSLYDSAFVLACPSCLESAVERAASRNTLGCLFAPFGLFFGTRGEARNRTGLKAARGSEPSEALLEYVRKHQATLSVSMRATQGALHQ